MRRLAGPGEPLWRRWTRVVVLVTAVAVPLIFDTRSLDAFARAKLAGLLLLVPLAGLGLVVGVFTGDIRWRVRPRWEDVAAAISAALAIIATVLAPSPSHALEGEPLQFQGLIPLLMYAAAYAIGRVALAEVGALRRLFIVLMVTSAVIAAYGIVQQLRLDPIWHGLDKGRIFSTLGQANNLAAFFVLVLPCVAVLAVTGRRTLRLAAVGSILLSLAALGLTLSRGGYLALLAAAGAMGLALAPWFRVDRRSARLGLAGGAILAVIVLTIPYTRGQVVRVADRLASTVEFGDSSVASHLDLWTVGFWITVDHPLLGTGPDSYALEFPRYRDRVLAPERAAVLNRFRPESPHDEFLAISSGLGVPALAAYLALVGLALTRTVRSMRANAGAMRLFAVALLGAIVAHVVSDAFMTAELTGSWLFWTFLGAAVSLPIASPAAGSEVPSVGRAKNRGEVHYVETAAHRGPFGGGAG